MRTGLYKFTVSFLILSAVFLILSSTAVAAVDLLPLQMDYDGDFTYHSGSSTPVQDKYWLEFANFQSNTIHYLNGDTSGLSGVGSDAIEGSNVEWIFSGSFFNDDDNDADPTNSGPNYIFGNTNNGGTGAGGVTGAVDFMIKDTVTNEVFLTAQFSNFIATPDCFTLPFPPFTTSCSDPRMNDGFLLNSLWSLDIGPDYASSSSRYIRELGSVLNRDDGVVYNTDINMIFTFISGNNQFVADGAGTLQGTLVVMPEPVSSILFIAGGVTLAVRRKKNNRTS